MLKLEPHLVAVNLQILDARIVRYLNFLFLYPTASVKASFQDSHVESGYLVRFVIMPSQ